MTEVMIYLLPPEEGLKRVSQHCQTPVQCQMLGVDTVYCIFTAMSRTDVSNTGDTNFLLFQEQTYYFSKKPDLAITLVSN